MNHARGEVAFVVARGSFFVIDEAEYQGPGGCYLWDADLAGYGVRIYPSGRKSAASCGTSAGRKWPTSSAPTSPS